MVKKKKRKFKLNGKKAKLFGRTLGAFAKGIGTREATYFGSSKEQGRRFIDTSKRINELI